MPLYQYECDDCGFEFDDITPMRHAWMDVVCKKCGVHNAKRVFGAAQVRTSNTYQNGAKLGGSQFGDATRDFYLNAARDAGVNPTGKFYNHQLAEFPGDPEAWVSGPDDVRNLLEKRNWACEGDLKVKCEPVERAPDKKLADDLMEDLVEAKLEEVLGDDFTEAKGPVVERAIEDVMNKHAAPY